MQELQELKAIWKSWLPLRGPLYLDGLSRDPDLYDFSVAPGPYWGDLIDAKVYLLFLNPTPDWYSWEDLRARRCVETDVAYRNLIQDGTAPFIPQIRYGNAPGHARWARLLRPLSSVANWLEISSKVCIMNLLPFASRSFTDREKVLENEITQLVVKLIRRLQYSHPSKLFIVCRRPEAWGLDPEDSNVFEFSPIQRRGVHLRQRGCDLVPRISRYFSD